MRSDVEADFYMNFTQRVFIIHSEMCLRKNNNNNKFCLQFSGKDESLLKFPRISKSLRGFGVYQHLLFNGIVCKLRLIEMRLSEFSICFHFMASSYQIFWLKAQIFTFSLNFCFRSSFFFLMRTKKLKSFSSKFFFRSRNKNSNFKLL